MDQKSPLGRASHTPICSKNPCSVLSEIPQSQHEFPWGKEQPESEDEVQDKMLMAGGQRCSQLPRALPESCGREGGHDPGCGGHQGSALLPSTSTGWNYRMHPLNSIPEINHAALHLPKCLHHGGNRRDFWKQKEGSVGWDAEVGQDTPAFRDPKSLRGIRLKVQTPYGGHLMPLPACPRAHPTVELS